MHCHNAGANVTFPNTGIMFTGKNQDSDWNANATNFNFLCLDDAFSDVTSRLKKKYPNTRRGYQLDVHFVVKNISSR